jgi:GT2 family glycosyltransferase
MLSREFPAVQCLALAVNEGGSGGFHEGMRAACAAAADWVWLLDDDTVARPDALRQLLAARERAPELPAPSLLASRVEWSDGRAHPMNMPTIRRRDSDALVAAAAAGLLPLRATTFLSLLVRRTAIDRHGLPLKHYGFQADDIEFTARILRTEHGYFVPESVVEHRTQAPHSTLKNADPRRLYHHVRNTLYMLRGDSWERHEKPVLAWVVAESSVRFLVENRFRPQSAAVVLRALRDGLRPGGAT